jgi:hypothetical protein
MSEAIRDFQAELDEIADVFEPSQEYQNLRAFFEEMRRMGLAVRHEYSLKQADISPLRATSAPNTPRTDSWFSTYVQESVG